MNTQKSVLNKIEETAEDIIDYARDFLKLEASGGILLVLAAVLAIAIANSGFAQFYDFILNKLHFQIGFLAEDPKVYAKIDKPLVLWINDGLMAIFFFLVGLEIKRELLDGELSSRERVILPFFAAIGGMIAPVAVFYLFNGGTPETLKGWAIPAATDIAFALGILVLIGSRVPISLKILLTAIAIVDDLGVIVIIAMFYTNSLQLLPFIIAGLSLVGLIGLHLKKVMHLTPYILLGIIMWVAVLKSGVHATLAGVITALFIPIKPVPITGISPLKHLEHSLHPWVAFAVLPIFAFANAGVSLTGIGMEQLTDRFTLGIALGLFVGKQLGVFVCMALAIILGLSPKPKDATWMQLYGVSVLCGVGFTMSLFVGGLAFDTQEYLTQTRFGVLLGSLASAILGFVILRFGSPTKERDTQHDR